MSVVKPSFYDIPVLHGELIRRVLSFGVGLRELAEALGVTAQKLLFVKKEKQSLNPTTLARLYKFCTVRNLPFPDVVYVRYRSGRFGSLARAVVALTKGDLAKIIEEEERGVSDG